MLGPGGVVVATCPSPAWDRIASRLGFLPGDHHEHALDRGALMRIFRSAGFAEIKHRPFMWAPIGLVPYAGFSPPLGLSLHVDDFVRRMRVLDATFVNQIVVATRPG